MPSHTQRETETESSGLKRTHDEFSGDEVSVDDRGLETGVKQQASDTVVKSSKAVSPPPQMATRDTTPFQSSPGSLTDAATNTPPRDTPSPSPTPTKNTSPSKQAGPSASASTASTSQPPAKRKRRTAAEKEAEEKEKAQKKKERDEKREAKQAEKAKADAEKQAKQDEKRRKKEEEERKAQEEKERKERAQPKLMSFFSKAPATPKKVQPVPDVKTESPSKTPATISDSADKTVAPGPTEYEKRFKPFYVHTTVTMAKNPFEMDEETRAVKSRILDEYLNGKREPVSTAEFDPVDLFYLPSRPAPRGRIYPPVRFTMEKMKKLAQIAEGSSEEDRKAATKEAADALRKIPIKSIKFYQDVRPPYRGTVTLRPYQAGKDGMRRLARNPTLRGLMPVDYDHDSEAEWESEGEDVDIDDEDEEDLDGDDDMDEFLDDSDDAGPARFVSANGLEPESTGLCWENRKRMGPNRTMYEHRMEFILGKLYPISRSYSRVNTCFKETLEHHSGIDPFSTKYWEPERPKAQGRANKDKAAVDSTTPCNAFKALGGGSKNGVQALPKKILENNHLQELKRVIQANPKIAKGGLIDLSHVALAHAKVSRNDIKEAISTIAERVGKGHAGSWVIKSDF
ncbi:Chromatin assembly factor 1 subunit rlf2 [Colletotrichum chlorophyti]|uniref:Chromatin assembly factor 1 subunit rlf2 n=1 Tax=Colletotrichum chlorophyti TaxID=708187 RepID=A0A1Q8S8E7_9PEZI|nr:Chromatin assembly factor 1 subunit rlf2 [Colletotrichum chlorophyti]